MSIYKFTFHSPSWKFLPKTDTSIDMCLSTASNLYSLEEWPDSLPRRTTCFPPTKIIKFILKFQQNLPPFKTIYTENMEYFPGEEYTCFLNFHLLRRSHSSKKQARYSPTFSLQESLVQRTRWIEVAFTIKKRLTRSITRRDRQFTIFQLSIIRLCFPPKFCINYCCGILLGICRPPKSISQQ